MLIEKVRKYSRYLFMASTGSCTVCGRRSVFLLNDTAETVRNHAVCLWCRSTARNRHVARCVLDAFAERGLRGLSDWRNHPDLVVLNTSNHSAIARRLGNAGNVYNTEYFDGYRSGEVVNGVRCENLEEMSFESECLDLIITEDVIEHVENTNQCLREIYRVLKPGGYHIFSVPFSFDRRTIHRFGRKNGKYVPIVLPVEYHQDGIRGKIPAYYNFGYDLLDRLEELGFEAAIRVSSYREYRAHGTFNCSTFVTRKPGRKTA